MSAIYLVYITTPDKTEARQLGMALVESRLVACVNIIDRMRSLYWWEGQIQEDQEVILIAKTTENNLPALKAKVNTMHSYECPCILCLPVTDGNEPYMDWIREQALK